MDYYNKFFPKRIQEIGENIKRNNEIESTMKIPKFYEDDLELIFDKNNFKK